ncbi:MAG TPA: peptidoglycan-associated lipoprotein Pal [Deltaproteobacteria bacterium]|nr:peptidoglycan-associated lipoprotein Pal [Deltaproteobacteria bacterium]
MNISQQILTIILAFGIAFAGAACQKKGPSASSDINELTSVPIATIHFDFDKYNIRSDARPSLEDGAGWLKSNPKVNIVIEGNTDEWGTEEYNLALGERRAQAAKSYLINLGISPDRMSTISYGESRPVDPAHNESAWAQNRRDDFKGRR